MLYKPEELRNLKGKDRTLAISRLLKKFLDDRKNLKYHELDFICGSLDFLRSADSTNRPPYPPYDYKECNNCVFRKLILIYIHNLDFLLPVNKGIKFATREEVEKDRQKMMELLDEWLFFLEKSAIKNPIFHEVKTELNKKLNVLKSFYSSGLFGYRAYQYKKNQHVFTSRYIYQIIYDYFIGANKKWEVLERGSDKFVIGHYCYVHIIYRHFLPSINGIDIEKSFHDEGYLDPFNLPVSLKNIISLYLNLVPAASFNKEWFIFSHRNVILP